MSTQSFRLPAEWEPQDGILLAWPTAHGDWAPYLPAIEAVFIQLVAHISHYEQVVIAGDNPAKILTKLQAITLPTTPVVTMGNVSCYPIATNDTWTRDCGPITVISNQQPLMYDFTFNGWGLKFPADQDNQLSQRLHSQQVFNAHLQRQPLVLEGGSIESDGKGTLLTTSECLLSQNRNPHLSKQQLEDFFTAQCGIKNVLWLDHGYLAGDDTDSHIDTLARLCPKNTIIYTACDDPADEHYAALKKMEQQLAQFRSADGNSFTLKPLPWPQAKFDNDGQRLPATYANFLIINGAVLVPVYDDAADKQALTTIQAVFPDRHVIAIDCNAVIMQHGSLHCLTMQLPQGTLRGTPKQEKLS